MWKVLYRLLIHPWYAFVRECFFILVGILLWLLFSGVWFLLGLLFIDIDEENFPVLLVPAGILGLMVAVCIHPGDPVNHTTLRGQPLGKQRRV